jgi:hypothetical protein
MKAVKKHEGKTVKKFLSFSERKERVSSRFSFMSLHALHGDLL